MRFLLLSVLLAGSFGSSAMAQPCGLWGNRPGMTGGCTVNDSTGRPAVRITEPYPGAGYRAEPEPGYRQPQQSQPAPYIGKPYGY